MLLSTKGMIQILCLCVLTAGLASSLPLKLEGVQDATGISVFIEAGSNSASSRVTASGSVSHIIADEERTTFRITDSELKRDVGLFFGREPDDAYLHSPTPFGDLYNKFGWEQVRTVLEVADTEMLGVTTESLSLKSQNFINNSSRTGNFDVSITDSVTNSVSSSWSTGGTLSVGQKFTYDVNFLGTGVGGETSVSYSQSWGIGGVHTKSVTMGSTAGVTVTLKPNQAVKAVLSASRGVMKVRITYKAYLTGTTAVHYGNRYKDHYYWDMPIASVMASGNNDNTHKSTEDIEIGYYSNGQVQLYDIKTNELLATHYV